MKIKTILITLIAILAVTALIFQSCKKEEEKTNQPPTCTITAPANGQEIAMGETVTISVDADDSDGNITKIRFFIDGVDKGSTTSFPYNYDWNTSGESLGNHTLKATSLDNNEGSKSDEISITIIAGGSAPIADFTATPTSGTAPLTVNFTDQSSNNPTSWQWEFGDGNTSTEQNPAHTYTNTGTYNVSLTAVNNIGSDTKTQNGLITVSGGGGTTPVANFTATPTSGTSPLTVNFTDQSTNNPTSWQWEFGDGETSTEQNPSHTYNNDGSYTVSLTVANSYGSTFKTKTNYISVESGGGGPDPDGYFTDPRDGKEYAFKYIGNQTWMAENLNYEIAYSWWYGNSSANGDVYGRLYTWEAALTACPSGWHLPSDDEWKQMEMALGMSQSEADDTGWRGTDEGEKMKSISGWSSNGNGTNSSGFTALPGGFRSGFGTFGGLGYYGRWWSATEYNSNSAWYRHLDYYLNKVYRKYNNKDDSFSVRCIRD